MNFFMLIDWILISVTRGCLNSGINCYGGCYLVKFPSVFGYFGFEISTSCVELLNNLII